MTLRHLHTVPSAGLSSSGKSVLKLTVSFDRSPLHVYAKIT